MAGVAWNDLPIFLAIAREGTLGGAARRLGQSQPTMGPPARARTGLRRDPFQRSNDGFLLTDEGALLLPHAERMEIEAQAMAPPRRNGGGLDGPPQGDVFGLARPVLLAPVLAEFSRLHPRVVVETLTDPRVYSLARREADLVIRLAPFDEPEVIARRLVTVRYAVYARRACGNPRPATAAGVRCSSWTPRSGRCPTSPGSRRCCRGRRSPRAATAARSRPNCAPSARGSPSCACPRRRDTRDRTHRSRRRAADPGQLARLSPRPEAAATPARPRRPADRAVARLVTHAS